MIAVDGLAVGVLMWLAMGEELGFDEGLAMGDSVGLAVWEELGFNEGLAEELAYTAVGFDEGLLDSWEPGELVGGGL